MDFRSNLQIEFKHKRHCDKLENYIKRDIILNKSYDCRLENTIMFKFDNEDFRNKTLMLLKYGIKYSKVKKRNSGIDYLYVYNL